MGLLKIWFLLRDLEETILKIWVVKLKFLWTELRLELQGDKNNSDSIGLGVEME